MLDSLKINSALIHHNVETCHPEQDCVTLMCYRLGTTIELYHRGIIHQTLDTQKILTVLL